MKSNSPLGSVPPDNTPYDATTWNGSLLAPTQNAVRDQIETMGGGGGLNNVVEDLTPQLGGDLDLNGHNLDFPTIPNISDCLDEDDMASDSPTSLATQQSIKAYADTKLANVVEDTTPQLGGTLDVNEKSVQHEFGTLTSDHTASGNIISATAGENLVFGDVCYFKSDGKFWKTDADAEATSKGLIAMAIATIAADAAGLFLKSGFARDDTWNWTVAAQLFLDAATAGGMTETAPNGSGDIVRLVAFAKAADYIEFNPSQVYLEIA
jgi:hypothetical protein